LHIQYAENETQLIETNEKCREIQKSLFYKLIRLYAPIDLHELMSE